MNLEEYEREVAINRPVYEALRDQIRRNYAGQYVALGLGRILTVAATFDEAKDAVERMQPVPEMYWVFPAEEEPGFEPVHDYFYPRTEGLKIDRETYEREVAMNRPVYEALRDQIQRDYAGQYVVFGQGRILAAAPDPDGAQTALDRMQLQPGMYWIFAADHEFDFGPLFDFSYPG